MEAGLDVIEQGTKRVNAAQFFVRNASLALRLNKIVQLSRKQLKRSGIVEIDWCVGWHTSSSRLHVDEPYVADSKVLKA